jgi:hypothetical protein
MTLPLGLGTFWLEAEKKWETDKDGSVIGATDPLSCD